jgi:hypothetical protein
MQLGPRGASNPAGVSPDTAVLSGASALAAGLTTSAPHPSVKTNRPVPARSAPFDLRMCVITVNCRRAGRTMRRIANAS